MTATRTQDRPTQDDTTLDTCPTCGQMGCVGYCEAEPTADDWADYEQYLDSLPESLLVPEDDASPEDSPEDAETSAAWVAAWLEKHGLESPPF